MQKRKILTCGICCIALLFGQCHIISYASHYHHFSAVVRVDSSKHFLIKWIRNHHMKLKQHQHSATFRHLFKYGKHHHWSYHALNHLSIYKLSKLKHGFRVNAIQIKKRNKHLLTHNIKWGWSPAKELQWEDSTPDLGSSVDSQGSYDLNVIRQRLLADTNEDRLLNQLSPLTVTEAIQKDADYRNPHVQNAMDNMNEYYNYPHNTSNPMDNWVHGVDTHSTGAEYFNNHHYNWHHYAANAGAWSYGYTKYNATPDLTPLRYNNNDLNGIADNINDILMNHDITDGNYNGHRKNILSPYYKYVGIGVTYNPWTKTGTFNEQFNG